MRPGALYSGLAALYFLPATSTLKKRFKAKNHLAYEKVKINPFCCFLSNIRPDGIRAVYRVF